MKVSVKVAKPQKDSKYLCPARNVFFASLLLLGLAVLGRVGECVFNAVLAFPEWIEVLWLSLLFMAYLAVKAFVHFLHVNTMNWDDAAYVYCVVTILMLFAIYGAMIVYAVIGANTLVTLLVGYSILMASIFVFSMPSWFSAEPTK